MGLPPQTPARQVSLEVQNRPSSQASPSFVGVETQASPCSSQLPAVQAVEAHALGVPAWQLPARQTSDTVQKRPSSQAVPSGAGTATHWPVSASHWPRRQPWVSDEQSTARPAQVPARQTSVVVQREPSSQLAASFAGTATHWSVASLQLPAVQAPSRAEQLRAVPRHWPSEQASFTVQYRPSLHAPPSLTAVLTQARPASSHVPELHAEVCAEQSRAPPPTQVPPEQRSFTVQYVPSSQLAVLLR